MKRIKILYAGALVALSFSSVELQRQRKRSVGTETLL